LTILQSYLLYTTFFILAGKHVIESLVPLIHLS
jgi:hypothetical protein